MSFRVLALFATVLLFAASCSQKTAPATELPPGKPVWVKIDPVQCQMNPWEQGAAPLQQGEDRDAREEQLVRAYFGGKDIEVLAYSRKRVHQNVCDACSCPRGDTIWLSVSETEAPKLVAEGWKAAEGNGQ